MADDSFEKSLADSLVFSAVTDCADQSYLGQYRPGNGNAAPGAL